MDWELIWYDPVKFHYFLSVVIPWAYGLIAIAWFGGAFRYVMNKTEGDLDASVFMGFCCAIAWFPFLIGLIGYWVYGLVRKDVCREF